MALYAAKLTVRGLVQGVSFRAFAKRNADLLGLKGFVKNTDKGVEVFAEGNKDMIETLVEALRNGPSGSHVRDVDIEWSPFSGVYKDFKIIY